MSGVDAVNLTFLADAASPPALRAQRDGSTPASFEAMLSRMTDAPGGDRTQMRSSLQQAAENLVSSAFIMPVLATLRGSSQAAEPFAPGTAERRFGPLLDQRIADSIVHSNNFGLVDSIVDRFMPADEHALQVEVTA